MRPMGPVPRMRTREVEVMGRRVRARRQHEGFGQGQEWWRNLAGAGGDACQRPFGYADNVGEPAVHSGSKERHVRADV